MGYFYQIPWFFFIACRISGKREKRTGRVLNSVKIRVLPVKKLPGD